MSIQRYTGTAITLFMILLSCISLASGTQVAIVPQELHVEENSNFTIDVHIDPDVPISGVQFALEYDPTLLTAQEVTEGYILKQEGINAIFNSGQIDAANGSVGLTYGLVIGKDAQIEKGNIASIIFIANNATGISNITLKDVIVTNSTGAALPVNITNSMAYIGDTSENRSLSQNSILLILCCLCAVFMMRKKDLI